VVSFDDLQVRISKGYWFRVRQGTTGAGLGGYCLCQ
jgi:hypothetical protein